jgi:hypothetical protein
MALQKVVGIGPLARMFLHLAASQLGMHAPGNIDNEIAELLPAQVMALASSVRPIFEIPE